MTQHEHGHTHDGHDDGAVHVHISGVNAYLVIFAALVFFTILTVALSYIHLGPFNLAIAIVIATIKATLVVLYFMHLKYDSKFNALVFVGTLCFVGVFLAFTIFDTGYRGRVDLTGGARVDSVTGEIAPGGPPASLSGPAAETHH